MNLHHGGISNTTGAIYNGNEDYNSKVKRSTFLDLEKNQYYIFKPSSPLLIRLYRYNAIDNSFIDKTDYLPEIEYFSDENEKVRFTVTQDDYFDVDYAYNKIDIHYITNIKKAINNPVTDKTLSKENVPADSKTVGDKINAISSNSSFFGAKDLFCIMQYNCGNFFNGSGNIVPDDNFEFYYNLQKNIIERYHPDILCLEEYRTQFSNDLTSYNFLREFYHYITEGQGQSTYHGKAIASNYKIFDSQNVPFTTGRNFQKAYIYLNGRKIMIGAVHFSFGNDATTNNEATQLLSALENEDYFIVSGDMNIEPDNEIMQRFINEGYRLINTGDYVTYPSDNLKIDNIITSNNIQLEFATVDLQKSGLGKPDHYPLVAYLKIR